MRTNKTREVILKAVRLEILRLRTHESTVAVSLRIN